MEMNSVVPNCPVRRPAVALALLIAPFAAVERAQAACDPTSPRDNATVTCTGTTKNDPFGYGSRDDTGNTINVQSGASVTGTNAGLVFHDGTVNNFGTVSSAGTGIFAN